MIRLIQNKENAAEEHWTESVNSSKLGTLLGIKAEALAKFVTDSPDEIRERQMIIKDMLKHDRIYSAFCELLGYLSDIKSIKTKQTDYTDTEQTLYSLRVAELYIDAVRLMHSLYEETKETLKSSRLRELLSYYNSINDGEDFRSISQYTEKYLKDIKFVKSFTVGINLDTKLTPSEIGIISMNDDYFVSDNFFTGMFRSNTSLPCVTPLINFDSSNKLLERSVYLALNDNLCKALKRGQQAIITKLGNMAHNIIAVEDDIRFFCKAYKFLHEIKSHGGIYSFPALSNKNIVVKRAYDPSLLKRHTYNQIIKNDISFDKENSQIFILTGANAGGKSVYVNTICTLQILFQLGLPIPAAVAEMSPVDSIFIHYASKAESADDESRFESECIKMKQIIDSMTEQSLILLDETFSSTASSEGAAVAYHILRHILDKGSYCVFSTHIHEITRYMDKLNQTKNAVIPMRVEIINGRRTYHIIFGSHDEYSHAQSIAKKYGLEFEEKN